MDRKKTGNRTQPDHGRGCPPLFGWMNLPQLVATALRYPFKYLQNAPKNIENDQNLKMLFNFY